jgi:hypothetical protein
MLPLISVDYVYWVATMLGTCLLFRLATIQLMLKIKEIFTYANLTRCYELGPVRLSLSTKSVSHSVVFFSHNKSANNTLSYDLSAKRTGRITDTSFGRDMANARGTSFPPTPSVLAFSSCYLLGVHFYRHSAMPTNV